MNIDSPSIASLAANVSSNPKQQAVQIAVLKKAMDAQSQAALALIAAMPSPPPAGRPGALFSASA